MSRKQQPEIPEKLLDALIRTVIEEGFGPGIDVIVSRAGVCKMTAYAKFDSRERMTVLAVERVASALVKNLNAALAGPSIHKICTDTGLSPLIVPWNKRRPNCHAVLTAISLRLWVMKYPSS